MKSARLLLSFAFMAFVFVCNAGYGQSDECRSKCSADKDSNNAQCPMAAAADPDSAQARDECLKDNQGTYAKCVATCPPPPVPPQDPYPPVAPMQY